MKYPTSVDESGRGLLFLKTFFAFIALFLYFMLNDAVHRLKQWKIPKTLIMLGLLLMVMQFVMGNVLEPQVMGRNLNLSPIIILLSLIFWGWLWGVVGMFLAVPITSALKIIFENIPTLKPLAAAMSGE